MKGLIGRWSKVAVCSILLAVADFRQLLLYLLALCTGIPECYEMDDISL